MTEMDHDIFISDDELAHLYLLADGGAVFEDALRSAGLDKLTKEEYSEVRTLWDLHRFLHDEAKAAPALRSAITERVIDGVLEKGLEAAEARVTGERGSGYTEGGAGNSSPFSGLISNFQLLMQMNWKIAAPLAVVVLAVVAVVGMGGGGGAPATIVPMSDAMPEATSLMQAAPAEEAAPAAKMMMAPAIAETSDPVEDILLTLDAEGAGDAEILADAANDAALVSSESEELSALTTSYDPGTF